jgi:hypothetical protein
MTRTAAEGSPEKPANREAIKKLSLLKFLLISIEVRWRWPGQTRESRMLRGGCP